MNKNSELLMAAFRDNPECETTFSALYDCLIEEGHPEKAESLKENVYTNAPWDYYQEYIDFILGYTHICVGDFLFRDCQQRVFPIRGRNIPKVEVFVGWGDGKQVEVSFDSDRSRVYKAEVSHL